MLIYYVVLPNTNIHDKPRSERCKAALAEINREVLSEGVKFFHRLAEAESYMYSYPLSGKFHCMAVLNIEFDAGPLLITNEGIRRIYLLDASGVNIAIIRPTDILKLCTYPLQRKAAALPLSPSTVPKT